MPIRRDEDEYDDVPMVRPVYERRELGDDPGMRLLLPVGLSGWAIASGYLGLISVLLIPGPFAVLTGILALRDMALNPKKHGMGRTIFGLIMGSLGSIGLLFVLFAVISGAMSRR